MGVDVIAISRVRKVRCKDDGLCDETHITIGAVRKYGDNLKSGCYVTGKGGRSFDFPAGSYAGYDSWRRQLSLLALSVDLDDVWQIPARYRGRPFVELLTLSDGVGPTIGPTTCAKLHNDFVTFAARARKHFLSPAPPIQQPERRSLRKKKPHHANRTGLSAAEELATALGGVINKPDEDDRAWMWDVYRDFRRAFKLASDKGFVTFC